jgi:hypothetical protein
MLKKLYPFVIAICCLGCETANKTSGTNTATLPMHNSIAILPFDIIFAASLEHEKEFTAADKQRLKQ